MTSLMCGVWKTKQTTTTNNEKQKQTSREQPGGFQREGKLRDYLAGCEVVFWAAQNLLSSKEFFFNLKELHKPLSQKI